jgi:hypothetical protein
MAAPVPHMTAGRHQHSLSTLCSQRQLLHVQDNPLSTHVGSDITAHRQQAHHFVAVCAEVAQAAGTWQVANLSRWQALMLAAPLPDRSDAARPHLHLLLALPDGDLLLDPFAIWYEALVQASVSMHPIVGPQRWHDRPLQNRVVVLVPSATFASCMPWGASHGPHHALCLNAIVSAWCLCCCRDHGRCGGPTCWHCHKTTLSP